MSNEGGERFRCLICSTSSPRLGVGMWTDKAKEDRKNLYKTVLVLHKLLQIPMWECSQYLISEEGNGQNITNSLKLCPLCADMVDQGRSILERIEGLQAQLQTLQATLQNQILSQNPGNQEEEHDNEEEDQSQNKIRKTIREEIRKNVCRSSFPSRSGGGGDSVGSNDNEGREIVSMTAITEINDNSLTPTPAGCTPVLAEETSATEGEQEYLRMEVEVGEIKTEEELGGDPLSFGYEVIDLASDNDEGTNDERAQDLDALVAEVTRGGVLYEVDQSQLEIQHSWSTQSSPSLRRDGSPLPPPPQRKRICSMVQDNPCRLPNSGSNSSMQFIAQISQQQQQTPQPQPGPSRHFVQRTQSLPTPIQTAQTQPLTLLQMLLHPSTVPSPPAFNSSAAIQIQPAMRGKQMVWSGILEWHERRKEGARPRNPHEMFCRIYAPVENHLPTVDSAGWPTKLIMQCIPKPVMSEAGPSILRAAKTVLFEFDQPLSPQVAVVTSILDAGGYAGCIHFIGQSPPCTVKLMALVYIKSRRQFVGIIPEQQEVFVSTLRNVIQTYNQRQLQATSARQSASMQSQGHVQNQSNVGSAGGSQNRVPLQVVSSQQLTQHQLRQQQQQQQLQNQNIQTQLQGSTVHHLPVNTLDSNLTRQRQLNLLQIQQLQQSLEQARRNEINFEIMQQGNNTITSFSVQQTDQQHNTFDSLI